MMIPRIPTLPQEGIGPMQGVDRTAMPRLEREAEPVGKMQAGGLRRDRPVSRAKIV
jgi:hypothetical protein